MPYIDKSTRKYFEERRKIGAHAYVDTPGELTYRLTEECIAYGNPGAHDESYAKHCEVIGALFCTALEYYRRAVAPYEDKKIEENGDVYPG